MTRKIIGITLLVASGALALVLFTNSRLIFPHVIGPGTLAAIGAILLVIKGKSNKSEE